MVTTETNTTVNFTPEQQALCDRLEAFELDLKGADLPFSKRLMQDNDWPQNIAEGAIAEYKKFMFLAVEAGHPVTPSDAVDQVWHLHLSYSRSYWEDFCPNVLQESLHHEPTQGGVSESEQYGNWYSKTLESYEKFFGKPLDYFWPKPEIRFGRDLAFKRINLAENVAFKRADVIQMGAIAVLILVEMMAVLVFFSKPEHAMNSFSLISYLLIVAGLTSSFVKFIHNFILAVTNPKKPHGLGGCGSSM